MKRKKDEYYSPLPKMMLTVMLIGLFGCVICSILYYTSHIQWLFSCAITFGVIAYHLLIRFISPPILFLVFKNKYNYKWSWFQQKSWEPKIYRFLKVKNWKKHIMTYDPSEFSGKVHTIEEIINNMCNAEVVHELIVVLSFTSLFFSIPFGSFDVFLITAILAALFDSIFIVVQRFNRPRLVAILNKQRAISDNQID
ncbi:MAG: hypothetical protein J1E41_02860 [Ruminococcus sp.]|nr:hypothetical protein [Ruminococcus sp.]